MSHRSKSEIGAVEAGFKLAMMPSPFIEVRSRHNIMKLTDDSLSMANGTEPEQVTSPWLGQASKEG